MAKQTVNLYALNRGEVSKLALGRVDVERLRLSAEIQVNWLPLTLGPMMLRPGTAKIGIVPSKCKMLEFIYETTDTALVELTANIMRLWVDDVVVSRVAVSTTISSFASGAWSLTTSGIGVAVVTGGLLYLSQAGQGSITKASRAVTVSGPDQPKEHALRIVVSRGSVNMRIGTSAGVDDIFKKSVLTQGTHSIAVTPNVGTFYVEFENTTFNVAVINSIAIEAAGVLTLPTIWGEDDLATLDEEQSGDVFYVACSGKKQQKIERRSRYSWSVVDYLSPDGPFRVIGDSDTKLFPSSTRGEVTVTASKAAFKPLHVGALLRLFHVGQNISDTLSAGDIFTSAIRVSGVSKYTPAGTTTTVPTVDRNWTLDITGTWDGTVTLQRSFEGADRGFVDYASYIFSTFFTQTIIDNLDNVVVWYRVGFKSGDYNSGTAVISMQYAGSGGAGIGRIVQYDSPTSIVVSVLTPFLGVTNAQDWRISSWNDVDGWPSAASLHEGRFWWAGNNRWNGSISDNYSSFNSDQTGDAGPIDRTIGSGPIANINWLLSLTRLVGGADTSIISARSNSFDEPLTPTNFNLKASATQGAARIPPIKIDTRGVFVQQTSGRVYDISVDAQTADYKLSDLTRLNYEICSPGIVDTGVQRQPNTRMLFPRSDGVLAILVDDRDDQVDAWWRFETDGIVEQTAVLPGTLEDRVYMVIKRTINGSEVRFLERWARIDECQGDALNKQADCHSIYSGSPTTTITGLDYLEGETVIVWGDGKDLGTYTVTGGQITGLSSSVSNAIVGLGYDATFKSAKLAYAATEGTAINQVKRVNQVGFLLQNTHYQGVKYGSDMDHLDDLPLVEMGETTAADTVWPMYDQQGFSFNGTYDTDSRLVLTASAPRPATVVGVTLEIATSG